MSFLSNGKSFDTTSEGRKIETDYTPYSERLKNVKILNQDYKNIIRTYDSPNTFFYLDPPYEGSDEMDIYNEKTDFDIKELSDLLSKIKGKFLLTFNYSKELSDLFKKYNQLKLTTTYQNPVRKVKELIVKNY